MEDDQLVRTDVEFALADAVWRCELEAVLGRKHLEDELSADERRGESGSSLRRAFEERHQALRMFREARGTA